MTDKTDYSDWPKEDLAKEIKKLKKRKKFGIVWDEEKTKEITEKLKMNKSWSDITASIITDHQTSKVEFEAAVEKFKSKTSHVVRYILVKHQKQDFPGTEVEHIMPRTIGDWQDDIIKWKN